MSILDWKNKRKELHLSRVSEFEVLLLGLKSLLMVEKNSLLVIRASVMRFE